MVHGGDIYRNKVKLDFSINVNPCGMPESVKDALHEAVGLCDRYPDLQGDALHQSISRMTGIHRKNILCGNGASELFLAIVHALKPGRIRIPVPSFGGYEYAAKAAGGEVCFFTMRKGNGFALNGDFLRELDEDTDLLFLANPANPAGNLTDRALMAGILEKCLRMGITVVADECFLELTGREEQLSLKEDIYKYPNLIVVRAFTKSFAIPGVRLGYLLCGNELLVERIQMHLPEWNLSAFAQQAGVKACDEQDYIKCSAAYINEERSFLAEALGREGIEVFPSAANFLLLYTKLPLFEKLLEKGILIRDCSSFRGLDRGYIRVAVKKHKDNIRLIQAVQEIARKNKVHGNSKGM